MNTIQVNGDIMYPYKQIYPIPKGQVQFSRIKFNLSEDWEGRDIIVQFVQEGKTPINSPLEPDGTCFVPDSVGLGPMSVYLRGYKVDGTSIATANGVFIPIVQGAFDGGEPEVPPSPDLYSKLVEKVQIEVDEAKKYAENAEIASTRMPKISSDNTWLIWDTETGDYVDTGVKASSGIEVAGDAEALEALAECGILAPAYQDGVFYTDTDGAIYVL